MQEHPDDPVHVAGCVDCQARSALTGLDVDLDKVWRGIAAHVWAPSVSPVERLAAHLLNSPGLARVLVTTPSLVLSWIVASVLLRAVGILFTHTTGVPWLALLAPALSGIAIAYAYGPGIDPAFEVSQTMPISDRMVLLVRGLAVFGVNAALGLVAALFVPGALHLTLGWLFPMTMISALALAGATLTRSANVGVAAALSGWTIVVLATAGLERDVAAAVAPGALVPIYLLGTALGIAVALYATDGRRSGATLWR